MFKKWLIVLYSVLCYAVFNAVFLYHIGFLSNRVVPKSIDSGAGASLAEAVVVNLGLIALFGAVHSVMARKSFKRMWTRIVPVAAERSTYVLQSSLLLALIMWQWRPLPQTLWSVESEIGQALLWIVFGFGVVVIFVSTFLLNHFEFTGLQQAYQNLRNRSISEPNFGTPLFYRIVRHPLQLGMLIAYWVTPQMTVGHALFAATMTIYILIGLMFEERDLVHKFGKQYLVYRQVTPKLIPGTKRAAAMSIDLSNR